MGTQPHTSPDWPAPCKTQCIAQPSACTAADVCSSSIALTLSWGLPHAVQARRCGQTHTFMHTHIHLKNTACIRKPTRPCTRIHLPAPARCTAPPSADRLAPALPPPQLLLARPPPATGPPAQVYKCTCTRAHVHQAHVEGAVASPAACPRAGCPPQ